MEIALAVAALLAGLAALVKSADAFVDGASTGAKLLNAPPLLVGMVVVGFGTSAPELTVSAISAMRGVPDLALGNAYGSNICNIALILGVCATLRPLTMRRSGWSFDLPALLVVSIACEAALLFLGTGLSRSESFVLLAVFAAVLVFSARRQSTAPENGVEDPAGPQPPSGGEASGRAAKRRALLVAGVKTLAGLCGLVLSSRAVVWGSVTIAHALGVSDLIVGLTIVALGTSLPELASSVAAVRHGEDDLAVGNILGSNLFNALAVVGLAGAISPMKHFNAAVVHRDLPVSIALTLALWIFGRPRRGSRDGTIGRAAGALFLASYVAYVAALAMARQN